MRSATARFTTNMLPRTRSFFLRQTAAMMKTLPTVPKIEIMHRSTKGGRGIIVGDLGTVKVEAMILEPFVVINKLNVRIPSLCGDSQAAFAQVSNTK
jgi:hypothetical protein